MILIVYHYRVDDMIAKLIPLYLYTYLFYYIKAFILIFYYDFIVYNYVVTLPNYRRDK